MDIDRTQESEEIVHFWDVPATEYAACGTNVVATAYARYARIWAEVDCKDCLKYAPTGEVKARAAIVSAQRVPADRTVENMVAAAAHIRDAIDKLINQSETQGTDASAVEVRNLVETIRATYETMLPK